jgi:hypothetical protein
MPSPYEEQSASAQNAYADVFSAALATTQAALLSTEGSVIVNIPRPDRFAIHKLIVAAERDVSSTVKAVKDVRQANVLIQYYLEHRPEDIAETYRDALSHGPGWRKRLEGGLIRLAKINPGAATALRGK